MTRDEKRAAISAGYHAGLSLPSILVRVGYDEATLRLVNERLGTSMKRLRAEAEYLSTRDEGR